VKLSLLLSETPAGVDQLQVGLEFHYPTRIKAILNFRMSAMRRGPESACRMSGSGNMQRKERMVGCIRGAIAGTRLLYLARIKAGPCEAQTMSMHTHLARAHSA
jgi:hypothetical protein